ncbi:hypothetical protein ACIB24_11450 [Spongisporangium articulatum]|uniref:Uncharacterized protein n=1 Tax=Spongisporangium articulatum TaxID=3362603 RepID=A0ABW8AMS3_9ACTN
MLDLQLENPTDTRFRLGLHLTGTDLVGAWTADRPVLGGYRVYEQSHAMTIGAPGVYLRRNVLRRKVFNEAGDEVGDELVAVNQARMMYQPFIEAG